jgi:hypothetical protein
MSVTTPQNSTRAPNFSLRALLRWLRTAIEAHARYRMKSAVSPSQFLQSERDIRRYRRLTQAGK